MQIIPSSGEVTQEGAGLKKSPPAVLSIAGFDPSSGAGCTADLKVFAAHGLYGLACPTALTVQSTRGVERSDAVSAELVGEMLECLAGDIEIAGVKIGMLASAPVLLAVTRWLADYRERMPGLPVVLDPVLRSSSGYALLDPEAVELMRGELLPLVSVVTPNLAEAALLAGFPEPCERETVPKAALAIREQMVPGTGAVVVTGGHLGDTPDDFLLESGSRKGAWFRGARVRTQSTHGTGCAFSSALLCALVKGQTMAAAVRQAKEYVRLALEAAYPIGHGRGPMHHLYALDGLLLSAE